MTSKISQIATLIDGIDHDAFRDVAEMMDYVVDRFMPDVSAYIYVTHNATVDYYVNMAVTGGFVRLNLPYPRTAGKSQHTMRYFIPFSHVTEDYRVVRADVKNLADDMISHIDGRIAVLTYGERHG